MNLLLVDDHTLFREGLRGLLANISPGVAIYEAATVAEAVDACRTTSFRMVLLDLGLTSTSGLDTLDRFRAEVPDVPVVVLSGDQESRHIRSAIDRGAMGFVPKSHSSDLMIAALRFVLAGGVYLPPHATDAQPETAATAFTRLSPRQQQVSQLLLQGCPNKVIARQLGLSEGTVKAHVSSIFQILGARNRVEAVMIAAKSGIKVL
jgi:DNA-binding NarL/FixJ family response regulator